MTPDQINEEITRLFRAISDLPSHNEQDTRDLGQAQSGLNAAYVCLREYGGRARWMA